MKTKSFEFVRYKFDPQKRRADFYYRINFYQKPPLNFRESLVFPGKIVENGKPKEIIEEILTGIHLILGISYYKLYCPSRIILNKSLSKDQSEFWNRVYEKGLGEFFYRNKIDFRGLIKFPHVNKKKPTRFFVKKRERVLLGLGGGKDSIVSLELLKRDSRDVTGFVIETQKSYSITNKIIKISKIKSLKVKRLIDPELFEKHPGSFNGHVPISAVYAFVGYFCSFLYDYSDFVVSNEYSSNFGNINYLGQNINHQWSKSQEFETLFSDYADNYFSPGIKYFSLLRPFYEIRIAKMFSHLAKKYFRSFTSCNKAFRLNSGCSTLWCGECPKCIFVFVMLSAFLSKKDMINIFGKNLYQEKRLENSFRDILGIGNMKPFDCVGTFKEARVAFAKAMGKFKNDYIIKKLRASIKIKDKDEEEVFSSYRSDLIPTAFKFLGMENALILGYGKEGGETKKYLSRRYPKLKVAVADEAKDGREYLKKQFDYDVIIKTPGIPKKEVLAQYTTATNIFFSEIKNTTIGITGTKGKSTVSSLIYDVLRRGGLRVKLLGNIGTPMLGYLKKGNSKEILVLELSSYQLDDLEYSPDIAVVVNIYPDHLNYHGSFSSYHGAKANIVRYQTRDNYFIYNDNFKILKKWKDNIGASSIAYNKIKLSKNLRTSLLGSHNLENIKAAVCVGRIFGVSDSRIEKAIEQFRPLNHRLQFVGNFRGVDFYDDAISTTPESTIAALRAIKRVGTIFLGGEDRGYDFTQLEKEIIKARVMNVVLFPQSGERIFLKNKKLNILRTKNMDKAVMFAYEYTQRGYSCLLSCASPSYSLWKNFEEKGDLFQYYVRKYNK